MTEDPWEGRCQMCLQHHKPDKPTYYLEKNSVGKDYTLFERNYIGDLGCEGHPYNLGYINWPDLSRVQQLLNIANEVISRTKA